LTKIAEEHISQVHRVAGDYPIGLTGVAKRQVGFRTGKGNWGEPKASVSRGSGRT